MQSRPVIPRMMSAASNLVLELMLRVGVFDAIHAANRDRLTVLNYHRIGDPLRPDFDTLVENISATPHGFARQLDYIRRRFNVVTVDDVCDWLAGSGHLPANPLLITFDDGYADSLVTAYPQLRQRNLPSAAYLSTACIGADRTFPLDLAAYCFHHTTRDEADLPLMGRRRWASLANRRAVLVELLECLKTVPVEREMAAIESLPDLLGVSVPAGAFSNLVMTWDQVRGLAAEGVHIGAHTVTHPALSRIPLDRARDEIVNSKQHIETELGRPVTSFAYPFGGLRDFGAEHQRLLQSAGFRLAFTLVPGPATPAEVRQSPFSIRRVYVGYRDSLAVFAAKCCGLQRFVAERSRGQRGSALQPDHPADASDAAI